MKKYISIMVCVLSMLLTACNSSDNETNIFDEDYEKGIVKKYISSFTEEYSVNENGDKTEVILQAPDFNSIINILNEQNSDLKTVDDVNSLSEEEKEKRLIEALKSNESEMKEYVLVVESTDEDAINDALWDKITYDMMMSELRSIKLEDDWEMEE